MSQHSLQELPQDPRKPCKSDELSSFFLFSQVLARSSPRSKRSPQDPPKSALKMPILGSMCAILATSWREVGQLSAILAHLGPSCRQDVLPQASEGSPERVPISTLGHLGARRLAKSLRTSPGPTFFKILLPFWYRFWQKLLRMLWKTFVLFSLFPFHAKPGLSRLRPKAWRMTGSAGRAHRFSELFILYN